MPPAARIKDAHKCALSNPTTPPTPHEGGPMIGPGAQKVRIGGMAAVVVGDSSTCVAPAMKVIATGSATVMIDGTPAAKRGDDTAHGGKTTAGEKKVLIG